jgi:hypothetical protein
VARTKITPFRFSEDALADIDRLKDYLSLPSRAAVVTLAVRRLARDEIPGYGEPQKSRKKSSKKSG